MHVVSIVTTFNRDRCLQRSLRCFLEQTYDGKHTMLIFNSGKPTSIPDLELPDNKEIILINRDEEFSSVGQKHQEALNSIDSCDLVTHSDVDDFYLPNHISEGVKGFKRGGKKAYKPQRSYYLSLTNLSCVENVFEPSIFVEFNHLKQHGYYDKNVTYHNKWLLPLLSDDIFVDPDGPPTFIYDWSGQLPVYKMSSKPDTNEHYAISQQRENDYGSGITHPISKEEYYKFIKQNGL